MNKIIILLILNIILFGRVIASESDVNRYDYIKDRREKSDSVSDAGLKLLKNKCLSCHGWSMSENNRIAPPMIAIKRRYLKSSTDMTEFVNSISNFAINPELSTSKMPGAIKRFGLMPKLGFNEEELRLIANTIYTTTLEKPSWFEKHYNNEHGNRKPRNEDSQVLSKAKLHINKSQSSLGKSLIFAIENQGSIEALEFCNEKAESILNESIMDDVISVKRVSNLNRNVKNTPNEEESNFLNRAKEILEEKKEILPKITRSDNSTTVYFPILTNKMCLQCHGSPEKDIDNKLYTRIKELYPEDKAIGYKENQIRGMWVIEMKNE